MNHSHLEVHETASSLKNTVSHLLLSNYYVLLILFHIPGMTTSLSEGIWLKGIVMVLSVIAFIYCLYRLVRNERLEDTLCMKLPAWVPAWVHRWMRHKSMMYMMIAMDIMLALMCVGFVIKGWI
ncbi:hypothetical protein [Ammoniphilus sp. CFH 90114]|uniref:hypothetical protein n=1 Tax=Ammoniphilus sp. CFH 90114 TaxID=2493665 RepID=UPI00100F432F|nr:hypothetical protein [Ammoniphilus sp. CFH 90114]RXT02754.1 hypothetical protein EIZ39_24470 [Ammoniphilus sp. CFH 90114]